MEKTVQAVYENGGAGFGMFHESIAIRQWNGNFYSPPNYQFVVQMKSG